MNKISTRHFMFLIFGTIIVPLKTYPNIIIQYAGRDAWISVAVSSIIIFLFTIFVIKTIHKTETYKITDVFKIAFGEKIGYLLSIFLCISFFFILIESCTLQASVTRGNLLIGTPYWYICLFFVIATYLSVKSDLSSILITSIIGLSFTFIAGIMLSYMTHKYKHIEYIYPLLEFGFNKNMIISIVKSTGCYSSIISAFIYFQFVNDKDNLMKNTLLALVIIIQMEIVSIISVITTFGPSRSLQLIFPKITQNQIVNLFGFIEGAEFFIVLQVIDGWFVKYIITFYALKTVLENLNIYKKYFPILFSILVFLISSFLLKSNFVYLDILNTYATISFMTLFIVPLIAYIILFIKNPQKNSKQEN